MVEVEESVTSGIKMTWHQICRLNTPQAAIMATTPLPIVAAQKEAPAWLAEDPYDVTIKIGQIMISF